MLCWYDEAFTIQEMKEETGFCDKCEHRECPNCGADMRQSNKSAN